MRHQTAHKTTPLRQANNSQPRYLLAILALLALCSLGEPVQARRQQPPPYDTSSAIQYQGPTDSLPKVSFIRGSADYLMALNADLYPSAQDLKAESRWIRRQSKELGRFWEQYGDSVLVSLATYAGLPWTVSHIKIHYVRYLSDWELPNPPTMPLGGKRVAGIIEAGPVGAERIVQLIHLLAHQLLSSASRLRYPELNHPLLKRSPYHRENITELLALSVAADILDHERLLATLNSPSYARRRPGYDLFFSDLWGIWTLSATLPLIDYLRQEAFDGLVRYHADSTLEASNYKVEVKLVATQRQLPPGGQFGLALEVVASGLKVTDSDPDRLAFAYGIFEGDIIRSVNGQPARILREFFSELLSTYESAGATLRIRRGSEEFSLIIKLAPADTPLE